MSALSIPGGLRGGIALFLEVSVEAQVLVLIDLGAGVRAMHDTREFGDHRFYYQVERTLLVCRNGLTLGELQGLVVDAAVGTEPHAMPGFCPDWQIGQLRTKITVYRRMVDKPAEM